MKKALLSMALLIACSYLKAQTTMEEYNYVTKGYKTQLESGLDMKRGYFLHEFKDSEMNGFTTKALVKEGQTKPVALMIIKNVPHKIEGQSFDVTHYICLPHVSSSLEVWTKYYNDLNYLEQEWGIKDEFYTYLPTVTSYFMSSHTIK